MMRWYLEATVFISGAVVMSLELCGSRLFAPFLGSSIYVWTSLIGIILASLSIGYWWGGKLADRRPEPEILSWILAIAGGLVGFIGVLEYPLLNYLGQSSLDLRIAAVVAAIVLFTAPSMLLGCVSPFAIRLRLTELEVSGETVGRLYALSTLGSIFGTFLTGFYLFAVFGSSTLIYLLAIVLLALSLLVDTSDKLYHKIALIVLLVMLLVFQKSFAKQLAASGLRSFDTRYHRVLVLDTKDGDTKKRLLVTDPFGTQSAMNLDGSEDESGVYYQYYDLALHLSNSAQKILLLGGGAYSYPKHFLNTFPDHKLTVVELDSGVTELARAFFALEDHPNMEIIHEDARTYLNRSTEQFDTILFDIFRSSPELPFHLTTQEAVARMHSLLKTDGILCINIISGLSEETGKMLFAFQKTLRTSFSGVELFQVDPERDPREPQNIIMIARKSDWRIDWHNVPTEFQHLLAGHKEKTLESNLPVLTDDFAPVERYMLPALMAMKEVS